LATRFRTKNAYRTQFLYRIVSHSEAQNRALLSTLSSNNWLQALDWLGIWLCLANKVQNKITMYLLLTKHSKIWPSTSFFFKQYKIKIAFTNNLRAH